LVRCFADRYHQRDLRTPLEARRALRYVLLNRQMCLERRARRAPPARDGPVVLLPRTWFCADLSAAHMES